MGAARFIRDLAVLIGAGRAADSFATVGPLELRPDRARWLRPFRHDPAQDDARFAPAHLLRSGIEPVPSARRRHALARRPLRLRPRRGARDLRCGRLAPGLHRGLRGAVHAEGGQGALGREDAAQHQPHRRDFPLFPAARFVHVLRDGRDVACSLRTHPRHKVVDGELVPTGIRKPIAGCARRWVRDIESSRRWWGDPRFMTVRYEDLVAEPETGARRPDEVSR